MLKGKLKLPDKIFSIPFEDSEHNAWALDLQFESGEELATFRSNDFELDNDDDDQQGKECGGIGNDDDEKLEQGHCRRIVQEISCPVSSCLSLHDDRKLKELDFQLSQEVIQLETLQSISSSGLPDGRSYRATTWKLLLGYLPASRDSWKEELAQNRLKYATLKEELLLNPSELARKKDEALVSSKQDVETDVNGVLRRHDVSHGDHPLNLGKASVWNQYFQDAEITEQINRDLQRTHPELRFFSGDSSYGCKTQEAMRNILLLFAKLNPAIRYVQGMNEVLAPLYYVFSTDPDELNSLHAEADSFACFVRLLSDSVDHFCQHLDNSSVGILSTLSRLAELLKCNDEELWRHLEITTKVRNKS